MSKVVEEVWWGKPVKGCWQTSGREGVYTRKSIANKILENRTEISDGAGPFAANREKKIREAFSKGREEKSKKIEQVAVAAPPRTTVDDVLQMLRSASGLPGLENIFAEDGDEQEQEHGDGDEQEQQEEEESSDDDAFARIRLLNFAGAAPEAAAKASSQSGAKDLLPKPRTKAPPAGFQRERQAAQASGPAPRITSGPTGSLRSSSKFRAGSLARSNPNRSSTAEIDRVPAQVTRPQVDAMELDGRGQRIQDALQGEVEKIASDFATLASGLASDNYSLSMTLEERKAFEKRVHSHNKELSKLTTSIKASNERISKSSNKRALRSEEEALAAWQKKVDHLMTFFKLVVVKNPPPHEFITALDACSQDGVKLPSGSLFPWYASQAQHAMMQDRFESVLAMCDISNNVFERLLSNGIPQESLPQAAQEMFDNTVLEQLGTLTEKEALLPTCQSDKKAQLKEMALESLKAFLASLLELVLLLLV